MLSPARPACQVGPDAQPSAVLRALRSHVGAYQARYGSGSARLRVLRRLLACRTEAMGVHRCVCEACGWEGLAFNPCRDRHCPQCQGQATARWLETQRARMLPVPHFQVVFTLPAELRSIAFDNPALVYGLLFRAAAGVLQDLATQRLGARLGVTAVLHTWSSDLRYHPHVHALVTAGGLHLDGERWVPSREDYLFPGKILGAMFRGRCLEGLIAAFEDGQLRLRGDDPATAAQVFRSKVRVLARRHDRWVVHVEPPKGRPVDFAAKYLARYVKRVAIGDARIVEVTDEEVAFRSRREVVRVDGVEFVRRFLLHVLPEAFRKVRHYGLYAPGRAKLALDHARVLVAPLPDEVEHAQEPDAPADDAHEDRESSGLTRCPACGQARVRHLDLQSMTPTQWPRGPP